MLRIRWINEYKVTQTKVLSVYKHLFCCSEYNNHYRVRLLSAFQTYSDFTSVFVNVLFLFQDPVHDTTSHLVDLSAQASLGSDNILDLPCLWMTWIDFFFSFVWFYIIIILGCGGSLLPCVGFLSLWQAGASYSL